MTFVKLQVTLGRLTAGKWLSRNELKTDDFSGFLIDEHPSNKAVLLETCKKCAVTPYVDDPAEAWSGVYAQFRAVASEAELEKRIYAQRAREASDRANAIATGAFLISIPGLFKLFC